MEKPTLGATERGPEVWSESRVAGVLTAATDPSFIVGTSPLSAPAGNR